jgi:acyl carrier protein
MTKDEFLTELANVLEESVLTEDRATSSIAMYDSLGVLGVIAMIQAKLQYKVDIFMLLECRTVGDLVRLVGDKLQD